jgi:hypothetical protein
MKALKVLLAFVLFILFVVAPTLMGVLLLAFVMYAVADTIIDEMFGDKNEL